MKIKLSNHGPVTLTSMWRKRSSKSIPHLLVLSVLFLSYYANSACNNCNQIVELNLSEQLSSPNNDVGFKKKSSSFTVGGVSFGNRGFKSISFTDVNGSVPPFGTKRTTELFQKIDDYFSLAIYRQGFCGTFYMPENHILLTVPGCEEKVTGNQLVPQTFYANLRIDRKLVGGTYAKRVFLGRFGVCYGRNCSSPTQTIATVYLNYNITVPQNCIIDSGEIVSIDFGDIPSTSFNTPGKIADRVTPVTRQLSMKCTNIDPFKNMSVRVQANTVSGNAIVSNNKDVGFVVGDSNRRELTPNQINSKIPFTIDGTDTASVPVTIWPVSVTGKTPNEGRVNAIGFLRVDFD